MIPLAFTVPGEVRGKGRPRIADEVLLEAYSRLGSVHKVGAEVGMRGTSAHERLTKLGAVRPVRALTRAELDRIETFYRETPPDEFSLGRLARELGRTVPLISRTAGAMGLTNARRSVPAETRARAGRAIAAHHAAHGHPRGMLGKKHGPNFMTEERRQKASDAMSAWRAAQPAENAYSRAKRGRRDDLGETFFRSSWEANYARYLNWLQARGEIEGWEYEPETFWFEAIKRGVRSYLPDFRVREKGRTYFVEVKGWMDDRSVTKLRRMKKYHPTVEVRLVDAKQYRVMSSQLRRLIPHWEGA